MAKKWCPLRNTLELLSKAFGWPGFGYTPPKIKREGAEVEAHRELEHKTNEVARQVELLEWELRRGTHRRH